MAKNKGGSKSKRQRTPAEALAQRQRTEKNKSKARAAAEDIRKTAQAFRDTPGFWPVELLVGRAVRRAKQFADGQSAGI